MGQSLVRNYIHIVFSTKYREPLIYPPYDKELYHYIGRICRNLECAPIKIGGYTDHIHILCRMSQKIPLMKLIEVLKSSSSKWMKTKDESLRNFFWQNGYGAFSVNTRGVDIVTAYIDRQYEHHTKKNFQKEYRTLLKKHKVDYDERYVWE
ncbi:MAG: IS200/IS605 family transposase [Spirochaetota bacterium]|nr:IS200/IS605 family transposase [Spirochaetota bacterium]